MDNLIQQLQFLFRYTKAPKKETALFKGYNHDQLSENLHDCLGHVFGKQIGITETHSIRDAGVDLICDDSVIKVGFQIKSYYEIADADKDKSFAGKVKSQITDSKKHGIGHLFILLCGNTTDRSQKEKMNGLKSEVSQFDDNSITIISSENFINIIKNPKGIKPSSFHNSYSKFLSTPQISKTELKKLQTELMTNLSSEIYIERAGAYTTINSLLDSDINLVTNGVGKRLFEIFKRDDVDEKEQGIVIDTLKNGSYFPIICELLDYWFEEQKLSGPISNYFSCDIRCLDALLDAIQHKDIENLSDDVIFFVFVAIRAHIDGNRDQLKGPRFRKIKDQIEKKWYCKKNPIIGEVYKRITGTDLPNS